MTLISSILSYSFSLLVFDGHRSYNLFLTYFAEDLQLLFYSNMSCVLLHAAAVHRTDPRVLFLRTISVFKLSMLTKKGTYFRFACTCSFFRWAKLVQLWGERMY
jgi:hypothetical protein